LNRSVARSRHVDGALVRTILLATVLAIAPLAAPVAAPSAGPAERLAGRALGDTPLMSDLEHLCDRIGGRMSGTPACERSVEWTAARFKEAGVEKVALEPFTVPNLWLPESAEAECISPERFPIRIVSAPYSPSTPGDEPLEGRLVLAGTGSPADFEGLGAAGRGAIALVAAGEMESLHDLFAEYLRNHDMLVAASKAKVAGLLIMSTRPRGLLYRHPVSVNATFAPMPVGLVSREHAMRLTRLAEGSDVRVRVRMRNRTGGPYQLRNVIAEITGRERPEEIVLLGAHLDSWDLGTGAEDNGVNVALVMDVARGMRELGLVPRRTVRFALFTGEEQGMWGSAGYVKTHADEMDDHVAVLIHDLGWGRVTGYYLNGREELREPLERAFAGVTGMGPFSHPVDAVDGTDNFDFMLSGVPNLVADQDATPYLPDYHAESDVIERVDARAAKANAAIAAAVVWALAESPERFGRRQTRDEVEKLIQAQGLESVMRSFGQWEDWKEGRRGAGKK
jgi:hypothetical protein